MRKLKILLVLVAVIFSGFTRDLQGSRSAVTVPLKFDGVIIKDVSSATVCTPTGDPYPYIAHARTGWLQGNQSHGGRLITDQSKWTILSCETDFTSYTNTAQIEGVNTVANGDSYFYRCTMVTKISTMDVTLYITITGGTGKYDGATGQAVLKGVNTDSDKLPVSGWGSVTFVK